jgi:hypothetical protein
MLNSSCKSCKADFKREWQRKNRDKANKYRKDYQAKRYASRVADSIDKKNRKAQQRIVEAENARQSEIMRALSMAMKEMRDYIIPQNEAMKQGKVFCSKCKKAGTPPTKWDGTWKSIQCKECIDASLAELKRRYTGVKTEKTRAALVRANKANYEREMKDPARHLKRVMRCRIQKAMKRAGQSESRGNSKMRYLGCTPKELRKYLEQMFSKGMSWDNMGKWHVDHVYPVASFDLSTEAERHKAFHYTNLQPLWAKANVKKSDSIPSKHHQPLLIGV